MHPRKLLSALALFLVLGGVAQAGIIRHVVRPVTLGVTFPARHPRRTGHAVKEHGGRQAYRVAKAVVY